MESVLAPYHYFGQQLTLSNGDGRGSTKMPRLLGVDDVNSDPMSGLIGGKDTSSQQTTNAEVVYTVRVKPFYPLNYTEDIMKGSTLWQFKRQRPNDILGQVGYDTSNLRFGITPNQVSTTMVTTHVLNFILAKQAYEHYFPEQGKEPTILPTIEYVRDLWTFSGVCRTDTTEANLRRGNERNMVVTQRGCTDAFNIWSSDIVAGDKLWLCVKMKQANKNMLYVPIATKGGHDLTMSRFGGLQQFWVPQIEPIVTSQHFVPKSKLKVDMGDSISMGYAVRVGYVEQFHEAMNGYHTQPLEEFEMDFASAVKSAPETYSKPNVSVMVQV
jgi:hypothetical protein